MPDRIRPGTRGAKAREIRKLRAEKVELQRKCMFQARTLDDAEAEASSLREMLPQVVIGSFGLPEDEEILIRMELRLPDRRVWQVVKFPERVALMDDPTTDFASVAPVRHQPGKIFESRAIVSDLARRLDGPTPENLLLRTAHTIAGKVVAAAFGTLRERARG